MPQEASADAKLGEVHFLAFLMLLLDVGYYLPAASVLW